MYIKRKTFSDKKKKRINLDSQLIGDSFEIKPLSIDLGRSRANKLDKQGKSDSEIIKGAAKYGTIGGALGRGTTSALTAIPVLGLVGVTGTKNLAKGAAISGAIGAGLGAAIGRGEAKRDTKDRLRRRKLIERYVDKNTK